MRGVALDCTVTAVKEIKVGQYTVELEVECTTRCGNTGKWHAARC